MDQPRRLDASRGRIRAQGRHACRSIDLVRYRFFGDEHIGLETVASYTRQTAAPTAAR